MKNLLAYAYLMMNFDTGGRSPLQVLERVIVRSLLIAPGVQTLTQLRETIERDWGLVIPIKVIRYSMGRLSAQQRVIWDYDDNSLQDTYSVKMSAGERATVTKDEELARIKYDRFRKKVNAELFREGLNQKYRPDDIIEGWLDKSALSFLGGTENIHEPDSEDFTINRIIAKTLGVAGNEDEEAISDLADLALGDALYRSLKEITEYEVEEGADPNRAVAYTAKSVQVFLDIGIVARALGYHGDEQRTAVEEMFKMAREVGYLICIFEHTLDELREIIGGAAFHLQSGSTALQRPMVRYAIRMGVSATDMLAQSKRLAQACAEIGILVIPSPAHDIPLTLDERELEDRIKVGVQQENPRARERDIDSLTSVFRLRDGEPKETLDSCKAIFITHNRTLQDVAHKFFRSHFDSEKQKNIVQLCMTDAVFSARLWTKLPTTVNMRPRNQVIAFALSNLAPARGIRESFLSTLRELVARERVSPETAAFVELSDFTNELLALEYRYGDNIDQSEAETVVRQVIEKAKRNLQSARSTGLEEGIRTTEAYYNKIMKEKEDLAIKFTQSTETEIELLRSEIDDSKNELRIFRRLATMIARGVVLFILFVICLGIAIGTLLGLGLVSEGLLVALISTSASIVLTWLTWKGLSAAAIFKSAQASIERTLLRWSNKGTR